MSVEDYREYIKQNTNGVLSSGSSDYESSSQIDVRRLRKSNQSSQEFTSSEHGTTGEFTTDTREFRT